MSRAMRSMKEWAAALALILALGVPGRAEIISLTNPGPSGSSTITANSTATSGGSAGCVWYNASSKMQCDSGFTYAGSGGAVATSGPINGGTNITIPGTNISGCCYFSFDGSANRTIGYYDSNTIAVSVGTTINAGSISVTFRGQGLGAEGMSVLRAISLGGSNAASADTWLSRTATGALAVGTAYGNAAGTFAAAGYSAGGNAGLASKTCTINSANVTTGITITITGGLITGTTTC